MALVKIKNSSFFKETGKTIKNTSFLQMFDVLKDNSNNTKMLNIWKSYKILHSEDLLCYFELYVVKENDWFENISYEKYETTDYWWVIAMFNQIENPFETLIPRWKNICTEKWIFTDSIKWYEGNKRVIIWVMV